MYLMSEDTGSVVDRGLQFLEVDLAQASEGIRRSSAASVLDDRVIVVLAVLDVANGDRRPGLHECTAEEPFVVSVVGHHLQGDGDSTGGFTPAENRLVLDEWMGKDRYGRTW